jgi:hypothetical protein
MAATLLNPTPFATFEAFSGARYTADVNGFFTNVAAIDVIDMLRAGFTLSGTGGNLVMAGGGLIYETVQIGIVAGTTRTLAGAYPLTKEVNRVDTSTTPAAGSLLGDGVRLPVPAQGGLDITIINNTLNLVTVYPGTAADQINGLAVGVGLPIPPGDVAHFEATAISPTDWRVEAGMGAAGMLNTVLATDGLVAAGSNQGTATPVGADINRVVSGSGGILLPPSVTGLDVFVINHTGAPIQIYGAGSDTVDDVAGATGLAQMNGSMCLYSCASTGAWYSNGIGTGYAGAYPTQSYTNAMTAFAGGGQASATPLGTVLNRVTTVATAGDSVKLPAAIAGMQITVLNATVTSMNVFPFSGDAINALAANTAYAVPGGKTATFYTTAAGFWHSMLSA